MRKQNSLARQEYDETYRTIRLLGGWFFHEVPLREWNDGEECALLSYDDHDSEFSGWINRQRMSNFTVKKKIKEHRLPPIQIDIDRW